MLTFNKNHEEPIEAFVQSFAEKYPVDYKILSYIDQDNTGLEDHLTRQGNRHWRKFCFYAAIGGLLPIAIKDNDFYYWDNESAHPWSAECASPIDQSHLAEGVRKVNVLVNNISKEENKLLVAAGCRKVTLTDLITAKLSEAVEWFTYEDTVNYLHNIGAKYIKEDECWSISIGRYAEVLVRYHEDHWYLDDGSEEDELKEFVCVNTMSMHNKHLNVVFALFYILSGLRENEVKGRKAYSPFLFVDKVYVGFTHDIYETARRHKVGIAGFTVKARNFFPELGNSSAIVEASRLYEGMGWSVFMQKGAKYIIVHAECVGFARIEGRTHVAWYADKEAKLTGRNLFTVATALEWVED